MRGVLHAARAAVENSRNFAPGRRNSTAVLCPLCRDEGPAFIAGSDAHSFNAQATCPACGADARHRGLHGLLATVSARAPAGPCLVFAPDGHLLALTRPLAGQRTLQTADLHRRDVDFPGEDIQNLGLDSRSVAMIVCDQLLEHVDDDRRAIRECARILMPGGIAVFTMSGDFRIRTTRELDRPDRHGHRRHYGSDCVDRMQLAFARVDAVDMGARCDTRHGVGAGNYAFVCEVLKESAPADRVLRLAVSGPRASPATSAP